jgi:hypothetical protein
MKQLSMFRDQRNGHVHKLTDAHLMIIKQLELAGGAGSVAFAHQGLLRRGPRTKMLRSMIQSGLIEVVGHSPAVYRVTELGRGSRRFTGSKQE